MTPNYTYRARVRRIVDADTIDVDIDMGFRAWRIKERLRLAGIDAWEVRGPEREKGLAAKEALGRMIAPGDMVTITTEPDPDNFGRWIAMVYMDALCLNSWLVDHGHAVWREY